LSIAAAHSEPFARLTLLEALAIEHENHPLPFCALPARFPRLKALSKDHVMANTKSAKKAARQTVRRTVANKATRSRMRGSVRKVEEAIASGNKDAARAALMEAMVHRKSASRKVSRLAKRIGAMGTP
jgi:small subunit ribosomal protein S20